MTPIYYYMKKIWCETDLVFDEFEICTRWREKTEKLLSVKIGTKVVKLGGETFFVG